MRTYLGAEEQIILSKPYVRRMELNGPGVDPIRRRKRDARHDIFASTGSGTKTETTVA